MTDNETIADIIAEMRKDRRVDPNLMWDNSQVEEHDSHYADRLEAAHKRDTKELRVEIERLKEERNYSGVRERERLRANGFAIVPKEQLERGDAAKLREALDESRRIASDLGGCRLNDYWKLNEIVRVCEAALAAPPRNCDKYSHDEALQVWASGKSNERNGCFDEWLYEIAKKGDGK